MTLPFDVAKSLATQRGKRTWSHQKYYLQHPAFSKFNH